MDSINTIFKQIIETNRDKIFVIDSLTDTTFTYGDFHNLTLKICSLLKERGIKKGDRVIVFLHNSVELSALYFAALYIGFIIVPVNTNLNIREIKFIVKNTRANVFIYSDSTKEYIRDILDMHRQIKNICFLTDLEKKRGMSSNGKVDVQGVSIAESDWIKVFEEISPTDIFMIMYTSGTTRLPKGVAHNLKSLSNNALSFIEELGISSTDIFYNVLSMAYMGGFFNLVMLPFLGRASIVIDEVFKPQYAINFWKKPARYKVNILWLVPTIMSMLLKLDRNQEGIEYCAKNIKKVLVGTAPLPISLRKAFENKYKVEVFENYGLSETLFVTTNSPKYSVRDGSAGKVLPGCSVSILDSNKIELTHEKEGEIVARSNGLMVGYLDSDTSKVSNLAVDEKFHTGDIGYLSSDGCLFITGRKKDLIIRGGINVSPRAIEEALLEHSAVEQTVVLGIPHYFYGEDIAAIVKLKQGYRLEDIKPSLIEYCEKNLSSTQQPYVFFEIEKFPVSATGKIDKNKLRRLLYEKLKITQLMDE